MSSLRVVSGDAYKEVGADDRRLIATVAADGVAVDLTGIPLTFMVKRRIDDADADALITKTTAGGITAADQSAPPPGGTRGVAYIALDEADTGALDGRYYWELAADDPVGAVTLAAGGFYVEADLIQA